MLWQFARPRLENNHEGGLGRSNKYEAPALRLRPHLSGALAFRTSLHATFFVASFNARAPVPKSLAWPKTPVMTSISPLRSPTARNLTSRRPCRSSRPSHTTWALFRKEKSFSLMASPTQNWSFWVFSFPPTLGVPALGRIPRRAASHTAAKCSSGGALKVRFPSGPQGGRALRACNNSFVWPERLQAPKRQLRFVLTLILVTSPTVPDSHTSSSEVLFPTARGLPQRFDVVWCMRGA